MTMERKTVALIIPTKDKVDHLKQTLPKAASLGFDEVMVIDSSTTERDAVEDLCNTARAKCVFTPADRLRARNLGAKIATTDWICIADDDVLLARFDLQRFQELAQEADFMIGGWGKNPGAHYAWIFRRAFFLETLKGYDPLITGGDDLDITLRARKLGRGVSVFDEGLYESETVGMKIAEDYPAKWIKNKVLYSLTFFPLLWRYPWLVKRMVLVDFWRLRRMRSGEPWGRVLFESFMDRAGTVYGPLYYLIRKRVVKRED
jgi:glycosyltransferase involved in cell wall biosynthesis